MKWYNEVRLGKLNRDESKRRGIPTHKQLIREFLEERFAKNEPAQSEEFCAKHPEIPRPTFYNFAYKWRDEHAGDPAAVRWFNEVRMEALSPPEAARRGIQTHAGLARQYFDQQFVRNERAKYSEFVKQYPEVSSKSFNNTSIQWQKKHESDPKAAAWYETTRLGGIPNSKLLQEYYDDQFAGNESVNHADFNALYRPVTDHIFLKGAYRWKTQHASDPKAMEWFKNIRLGENLSLVQQFHDAQFAKNALAMPPDFNAQYGEVSVTTFWIGAHRWKDNHASDPAAMLWFKCTRLGRLDQEGAARRYLNWKFAANAPASLHEAQTLQPNLQCGVYKSTWEAWVQKQGDDEKFHEWVKSSEQIISRSTKMGKLFEQDVIATIYPQLHDRGIQLHYNTAGIAELGKRKSNRVRDAKKVEIRLFTQDLLAPASGIGPALQQFLQESNRPHVAVDVTLGEGYGNKITKYADEATNLLVVTPRGTRGQRQLESHVRVISFAEFLGSRWLNVDVATRETLLGDLKGTYAAMRGGPESPAWQHLKASVDAKWKGVKQDLKNDGSQARYMNRVADDVAHQLRQGTVPAELMAYAGAARAAGHVDHADRTEGLAQAVAALAQDTGNTRESPPPAPKRAAIDPARLAEAQEFAKALQTARDAETTREKDKRGIDPARLAEAREFARVLQGARDADEKREAKSPEGGEGRQAGKDIGPRRLAEAKKFTQAIQEARDADAAKEKITIDHTRLAEAQEYAKVLKEARDADTAKEQKSDDLDSRFE